MEDPDDENVLQKPKEKKPRTAKQVEAFENAKQKRVEILKIKREQIQEIKASKPEIPVKTAPICQGPVSVARAVCETTKTTKKKVVEPVSDDEEEEQQVIIVKKKPKKKKPIVIYEDSESEEDVPVPVPKPKRQVVETIVPVASSYKIKFV